MEKRVSLLEKYELPISHLDFNYIEKCSNGREIEKIVHVLRSGQEGFFPDLTKCAEEKLKKIKPNSKLLRTEEKILTKDQFCESEWIKENEPLAEWSDEVKLKDNFLLTIPNEKPNDEKSIKIPPIRNDETKKIYINGGKPNANTTSVKKSVDRIKSTDYRKWDKFDADTEILKMDLDEERNREEIEIMNKKNLSKSKKIQDVSDSDEILNKLTNVEKEALSTVYKDRGNEYFKTKEYDNALIEYNQSIKILPSVAGYNNRAIAYLKLLNYKNCLEDCDKCLSIEPKNIKALLRKGQALLGLDKRRDAYDIYTRILSIEPSNIIARNNLNDLKTLLNVPPVSATRIQIQDEDSSGKVINRNSVGNDDMKSSDLKTSQNNDSEIKTLQKTNTVLNMKNCITDKSENKDSEIIKKIETENSVLKNSTPSITENKTNSENMSVNKQNFENKKTSSSCSSSKTKIEKSKKKLEHDDYEQEDLAKLIMPKKIIKNKFSETLELMKNNKTLPINKTGKVSSSQQPAIKHGKTMADEIRMLPKQECKFGKKTGSLIEEIK